MEDMQAVFDMLRGHLLNSRRRYLVEEEHVTDIHELNKALADFSSYQEGYDSWQRRREEEFKAKEQEEIRLLRLKDFDDSVPTIFRGARISDFDGTFVAPYIDKLLGGDAPSWICLGRNGVGKTRLAYALGREWCDRGESFEITDGMRLTAYFRANSGAGTDICERIEGKYGWPKHLVIDEVDKLRGSENDIIFLTYLINIRYEKQLQTILFGNRGSYVKVEDIIGASAYSRLTSKDCLQAKFWNDEDRRALR